MSSHELNFDGLAGPTHNYAGLSPGNLASTGSAGRSSHPRAAALQGLAKMARLHGLGIPQAVLPPQPRPDLDWLRALGFEGKDARVVERAAREAPQLLASAYSASSMWTANAATVIPSPDASDGRTHFVPANLSSERHRALESRFTSALLKALFRDAAHFAHHPAIPLPGDEGAANHTRLCRSYGEPGLEIFVFGAAERAGRQSGARGPGRRAEPRAASRPSRHPARQSEEASRAVARVGRLDPARGFFFQQSPEAIDAGVFHNDVIATGDRSLLLVHEDAWVDQTACVDRLRKAFERHCHAELRIVEVARSELSLARAVETYLFNCQIVERPDGTTAWVGPLECREDPATAALLEALSGTNGPFDELHFVDLRESMRNGGGPACLRLRVVLNEAEQAASHAGVRYDEQLHERLAATIERHYRETLRPADLADPMFVDEARGALDALTTELDLGSVYDFQRS